MRGRTNSVQPLAINTIPGGSPHEDIHIAFGGDMGHGHYTDSYCCMAMDPNMALSSSSTGQDFTVVSGHFICDMGFPSVCCEYVLLPLVDKSLAYGKAE